VPVNCNEEFIKVITTTVVPLLCKAISSINALYWGVASIEGESDQFSTLFYPRLWDNKV